MPDFDDALLQRHLEQAAAAFPGPDYYAVLAWVHQFLRPRNYVEVGIREGASLRAALPETLCIGIDPQPALQGTLPSRTRIFAETSNAFFAEHDLAVVLGAPSFDLAFIDGLHLWEQALRDFIHLERFAGPKSVVMLHDCLPLDEVSSERVRTTHFYSGDVWKLAACLRRHRPELAMATVRAGPTGLTLVTGLDRHSQTLASGFERLVADYGAIGFQDYQRHPEWMPETIGNDWEAVQRWVLAQTQAVGEGGP
jgi:Methyltransferase domain